ncbi:cellobiose transport system permease [Enterococcus sp. AZ194]|uniref:carbohydrate ABC transporter permease n=1 Tax=Enterococcus sp. AZ194 TaxID=2774629 RepID=UPI003F27EAC1
MNKKQKRSSVSKSQERTAYVFISPFYLLFIAFSLIPIIFSFVLALSKWDGIGNFQYIGFENFSRMLQDMNFWRSIWNTLIIWVMSTVPQLVFALGLAYITNLKIIKHKSFYKIAYFLPYITSVVAVALIFSSLFGTDYGLINAFLKLIHLEPKGWMNDPMLVRVVLSLMVMWRFTGYNMVIYLAGLQKIPLDLYEASTIDGASTFQTFRHIIVPLMKPIIFFTVIMSTIGGLQIFTEPQVLLGTNSSPEGGGMTLVLYLYNQAFLKRNFGYGAALSWGLVVLIGFFSALNAIVINGRKKKELE